MPPNNLSKPNDCRIFITDNGTDFYQIFSFSQSEKDGSLYIAWPDIENTKWLLANENIPSDKIKFEDSPGKGKISFHGSGRTHFKIHGMPNIPHLILNGNILYNKEQERIGARHLLTVFIKKPEYKPDNSPVFNRKHDQLFRTDKLKPTIFIFFAIPQKRLHISFNFGLQVKDMENIPNDILGYGLFPMRLHVIFWLAYRTKHLNDWPKYNYASFSDGYKVPLFIGQANHSMRVELCNPIYSLNEDNLHISLASQQD